MEFLFEQENSRLNFYYFRKKNSFKHSKLAHCEDKLLKVEKDEQ